MKRRHFLALGFCVFPYVTQAFAVDYREYKPEAWKASSINEAAMAIYGKEKFATIQKSGQIELIVPKGIVKDREEIPIMIRSNMKAKTVAIFQDANPKSLVAVFHVGEEGVIEYAFNMRMAFKGTVFAVLEGMDEKLYYTRAYVDILTLSCMASGE
ncbi:MAG: thiosulfate oxidation carrier protein SoxY [Sulfurovum sp.]|uniref:thiosulfate oxidation carrier protein SoxY n=1 Tax=Sulfurovum sp. TaxID=1969726 RepID=UPI003C72A63D